MNWATLRLAYDNGKKLDNISAFTYDYPSIDFLVDWARKMNMQWRVGLDIFIMQKR